MSYFTDFLARRHQQTLQQPTLQQQTAASPMQPVLPNSTQQSPLYNTEKFNSVTPKAELPAESPAFDTSNAIKSLADMMVTPAEREAQQARLERGRNQMAMWTGLFDGLRQVANLYYTAKGARPQQYSDPYKQVDDIYNHEVKKVDDLAAYRNKYAQQLYNLQRQAGLDEQTRALNKAKEEWYKNRDDQNAEKVAVQRFRAETDRMYKTATLEQKERMNDIMADYYSGRIDLMEAQKELAKVRAANGGFGTGGGRGANNGTYGYKTTTYIDEQGRKITERVPTTNGNQPRGQEQPTTRVTEPKRPSQQPKPENKTPKKENNKKRARRQNTVKDKTKTQL